MPKDTVIPGWIKVPRSIVDSLLYTEGTGIIRDVYFFLAADANYKDVASRYKGADVLYERGHSYTSIAELGHKLKHSPQQVRTALKKLVDWGFIDEYATSIGRDVAVLDYAEMNGDSSIPINRHLDTNVTSTLTPKVTNESTKLESDTELDTPTDSEIVKLEANKPSNIPTNRQSNTNATGTSSPVQHLTKNIEDRTKESRTSIGTEGSSLTESNNNDGSALALNPERLAREVQVLFSRELNMAEVDYLNKLEGQDLLPYPILVEAANETLRYNHTGSEMMAYMSDIISSWYQFVVAEHPGYVDGTEEVSLFEIVQRNRSERDRRKRQREEQ